jgi:hypothetical protein
MSKLKIIVKRESPMKTSMWSCFSMVDGMPGIRLAEAISEANWMEWLTWGA